MSTPFLESELCTAYEEEAGYYAQALAVAELLSPTLSDGHSGLIDGNAYQVVIQLYGIAAVVIYDAIVSLILLKIIDVAIGLRVDVDTEREGLDLAIHGEVVQ